MSLWLHGDGEPLLIYFEDKSVRLCYSLMLLDIADSAQFRGTLEKGIYFDLETPYGYGGPLVEGEFSDISTRSFRDRLAEFCKERNIVSQFIRFHPLMGNHILFNSISETRYIKDTVYIDASSEQAIIANMDNKCRNMIRKAEKSGVYIVDASISEYKPFLNMYKETMYRHSADDYYTFSEEYFDYLKEHLATNIIILYAFFNNQPISGALFLFNERFMHYHLAGSDQNYRNLAPSNLILYEASRWACARGIGKLHLGGGLSGGDSLFAFKKQFNKYGRLPFYVGRTVFNRAGYDYLLKLRKRSDPVFDIHNPFMIQYRR